MEAVGTTKRGGYKRADEKGIRSGWEKVCLDHMTAVRSDALLVEDRCSKDCTFGKKCIQNSFTVNLLNLKSFRYASLFSTRL
eukprot:5731560-Pleurochrysis_carterae.AAC.1